MSNEEMQRPEGALLAGAIKASGRSMRNVAAEVGISDTRLRHIINGYQPVGRGQVIEIVGPADTLARVAGAVGVSGEAMAGAGRDDVAELLTEAGYIERGVPVQDEAEFVAWLNSERDVDPPESALFWFSDLQIANEVRRRIENLHGVIDHLMTAQPVSTAKEGTHGPAAINRAPGSGATVVTAAEVAPGTDDPGARPRDREDPALREVSSEKPHAASASPELGSKRRR